MSSRTSSGSLIALPPLPFDENALSPAISERTISFHYHKHHAGYVEKLNTLIADTPYAGLSLDEIVKRTAGKADAKPIFNNAAQAWNHSFYWHSLSPKREQPGGALKAKIDQDLGGLEKLKERLAKSANEHFGSGWAWLIMDGDKLAVVDTADADTPFAHGKTCLLTIDVWEHAYYLDYQNLRPKHTEAVINEHLNWSIASARFDQAAR